MPLFTILLPVNREPNLMNLAVKTVEFQTIQDYELFIICDGAPENTRAAALQLAENDSRVTTFIHEKGERNGESYRNPALEKASGTYVCHIADDDLWLTNHLEEVEKLLRDNDFGNTVRMNVRPNGEAHAMLFDISTKLQQNKLHNTTRNFFGISNAAYRMSAYNQVSGGWSPAPLNVPSDLFMWRKFLNIPGMKCATRFVITTLILESPWRIGWDISRRTTEMTRFLKLIQDPAELDLLIQQGLREGVAECIEADPAEFETKEEERASSHKVSPEAKLLERITQFDADKYLKLHPDVKHSGLGPYEHFVRFGIAEGRIF